MRQCCEVSMGVVGEASSTVASGPEFAWGMFGGTEAPRGCRSLFEEARDGEPCRFLLKPRDRGEEGGIHSKEDAVPAVVRNPKRADVEGRCSWHVLVTSWSNLPRRNPQGNNPLYPGGEVLSPWRSAESPVLREVEVVAVFHRGRRMLAGVRGRNR